MQDGAVSTQEQAATTQVNPSGLFSNNAWSETPPDMKKEDATTQKTPNADTATETNTDTATTTQEPVIEVPKDWLKKEFGIEDPEILKAEREEFKTLKSKPVAEETKWENEESKNLHELFRTGKWKEARKVIDTQDRIAELTSIEVNDSTAADIIKMGMQLKYKDQDLTPSEIDYKYNKEFGLPKEPQPKDDDLEGEFEARKAEWQERVNDIKMNRNIEAKLAKSELEKAKVNLVLPQTDKPTAQANEPTKEQIEEQKRIAENFLNKLESDYSKAEGFSTKVKDESVELPVSFKIPDEDKAAIKGRLQQGFDIADYMDKRWFDENNNPKIEQIMTDIYQLENLDKILSGIANNSANERLIEYRKAANNIHLKNDTHQQAFQPSQNGNTTATSPYGKNAWSEKPPVLVNN